MKNVSQLPATELPSRQKRKYQKPVWMLLQLNEKGLLLDRYGPPDIVDRAIHLIRSLFASVIRVLLIFQRNVE